MSDIASAHPLTDQALARLRRLADGNGFAPADVILLETQEKIYQLGGVITLTPAFESQSARYPGAPRGKDRKILPNLAALKQEIERRREAFQSRSGWIADSRRELEAAPGLGWGLDGAKITFTDQSLILAASENCPACQGRKLATCRQCAGAGAIVCLQCRGQRQEMCYSCGGSGTNPGQPGQVCAVCNGNRFATCRACRGLGQQTCPTCRGQRGTACPGCQGLGQITEEAAISCGAATHFRLVVDGLPSGLRRGLDRLGIAKLAQNHADIAMVDAPLPRQAAFTDRPPDETLLLAMQEGHSVKEQPAELHYRATLPYADLKIRFGPQARAALVSAFGKRCALLGVPNFLDAGLKPALDRLAQAARGQAPLAQALEARAVREALELAVTGKDKVQDLQRLYPVGLSAAAAREIVGHMRRITNRFTLPARLAAAGGMTAAAGAVFAWIFCDLLPAGAARNWPGPQLASAGIAALPVMLALSWLALGAAARFSLRRRFPQARIPFMWKSGNAGFITLAAILIIWLACLFMGPVRLF